jgi:hypothetical protein
MGLKPVLLVFFGFNTGIKGQKLIFSSIFLNSPFVSVLNPKNTNFSPIVPVLSPQEIEEK